MKKIKSIKRKLLALILTVVMGGFLVVAEDLEIAYTILSIISGNTTYIGRAVTTKYSEATPSTNSPVWAITKIVEDGSGNLVSVTHAYSDDGKLYGNAFSNYVGATYK